MSKKNILFRQIILLCCVSILIFLDQFTKAVAVDKLKGNPEISVLGDLLVWQYAENQGAAFSILQGKQWPLAIMSIIIVIIVLYLYEFSPNGKKYSFLRMCYIMIIAGAIGNMIDRFRLNYVVDFIYVKIINFPIFNVADICVTVSCILLIILFLFVFKEDDNLLLRKKKQKTEDRVEK